MDLDRVEKFFPIGRDFFGIGSNLRQSTSMYGRDLSKIRKNRKNRKKIKVQFEKFVKTEKSLLSKFEKFEKTEKYVLSKFEKFEKTENTIRYTSRSHPGKH